MRPAIASLSRLLELKNKEETPYRRLTDLD
jgi:hypothetical protein